MTETEKKTTRQYRKKKRAKLEDETRLRITEALVELHGTIGPASTTITEVADRAGVTRMTVYNHFPTAFDQFEACSSHWLSQNPPPDLDELAALFSPKERLTKGLAELYGWYRETEGMMDNVLRDAPLVPAVGEVMDAKWWPYVDELIGAMDGEGPGKTAEKRKTILRLVSDFRSWQILTASGLSDEEAAEIASHMVNCLS
jgi:AcrR family transcriptional regulator